MSAAARLASDCPQVGEQLRARYRVVLLDEYQDTGHSQRIALSALFGGGRDDGLALTAVGDPIQSIYGWRGASATNLPRFTTDFPRSDGSPAPTLELLTSWRNPPRALHLANEVSAEARRRSVAVQPLRSRPGAQPGTVLCALQNDVVAERDWLADHIAARYDAAAQAGQESPTAAVLVRRNADAGPIADALTARGVPVEVVGLAGLLSIPEVAQVVSMLRLVADPTAGAAAMAVLTGPRWRLGAKDLAALWRRAVVLDGQRSMAVSAEQIIAAADAETASLADALADPGAPESYSELGYARITALATELARLRGYLAHPVTDLAAEVRRVLGVDAEVRAARPVNSDGTGTEHLDRLADIIAGYTERGHTDVTGLLAYLDAANEIEKGLAPAEVSAAPGRVQILTVHAAKGLEWQIVAVPHLCARVFPSTALARTWLNDAGALPPLLRGDRAEHGVHGVPVLDTSEVNDRRALETVIDAHRAELARRRIDEERRLLYVALTRAEDTLLLSGHHWGSTASKPRGPSDFLVEIRDIIDASAQAGDPCGVVEHWAAEPADGDPNPLCDNVTEVLWPVDPLRARGDVERGAAQVTAAMAEPQRDPDTAEDPDGWIADVDALLAERACAHQPRPVTLPTSLSVSALVDLDRDRDAAARRLIRRLPSRPDPHAILGTAFHDWVQRIYGADRLFDLDDLPGSGDAHTADVDELQRLQDAFTASPWAARTPVDVEVGFEMAIGDTVVRGRIDAVFADPDGGVTIVDWKTGEPPADDEARRHVAVQLAVYRLAWAGLTGRPEAQVRAAFHYVRSGRTVTPDVLLGADELQALLSPEDPAGERCA